MPARHPDELTHFLSDMYSVEQQALAQLKKAPDLAGDKNLAAALRAHYAETERQAESVRTRLEARGGSPSVIKDAIMKLGGKGFLLFAKLQPETPGKLLAHSYAYEAMEWAGYQMLANMAERFEDRTTAELAQRIGDEEGLMMHRLEQLFDAAEAASHDGNAEAATSDHLQGHLAEAHALEMQLETLLDTPTPGSAKLNSQYEILLRQSQDHADAIESRLQAHGSSTSAVKDGALGAFGLNWRMFFNSQSEKPLKLAAFVYALEHLKIAGYELLLRSSQRAGDPDTVSLCRHILDAKRRTAEALAKEFPAAVAASLSVHV